MSRPNFANIKTIDELRVKQERLAGRAERQGRALNRHLAEFWAPWKTVGGTIASIWSITSSFRNNILWWVAKPLLGKALKLFKFFKK